MRRPSTSMRSAPRQRSAHRHRSSARGGLLALLVLGGLAVAVPAWAVTQDDAEGCADAQTAPPLDEYGFPVDPGLLVPCDELVADPPPANPSEPSPALTDPDPDAGSERTGDQRREDFHRWRGTTAASVVDEYFQALTLLSVACDPTWFDQPYDGSLRVAAGTTWRAAAHTALASIPDSDARAVLYAAQRSFWAAGADCELSVDDWLDETDDGLDALEAAGRILGELG